MIDVIEWVDRNGYRRTPYQVVIHERLQSWDIRSGEACLVIGGYDGFTVGLIHDRYPEAEIYTFEPQAPFYELLRARFAGVPQVHVYPYGLGIENGRFPMVGAGGNEASFLTGPHAQHGPQEADSEGELREFTEVMAELGIERIAWLHSNCEQYEYLLFPHLLENGWAERIDQIVVQLHPFPEGHPYALPWPWIDVGLEAAGLRHIWNGNTWVAYARSGRTVRDVLAEVRAVGIQVDVPGGST